MTRVLLIEDEETSREIARLALGRMGLAGIAYASDGEHGLKLLDRMDTPPDVVISDIFMPNKDGIEIIDALAERKFAGGLIFLTGADPTMLRIAHTLAVSQGLNVLATLRKPLNELALASAFKPLRSH